MALKSSSQRLSRRSLRASQTLCAAPGRSIVSRTDSQSYKASTHRVQRRSHLISEARGLEF
eukprot:scaffold2730_cov247-Pinguiococcus_pyrenoidosus.AAC.12